MRLHTYVRHGEPALCGAEWLAGDCCSECSVIAQAMSSLITGGTMSCGCIYASPPGSLLLCREHDADILAMVTA